MSSKTRKVVVDRLRAEGFQAYVAGKLIGSCPYQHIDGSQWKTGWRDAEWKANTMGTCRFNPDPHAINSICENWKPLA